MSFWDNFKNSPIDPLYMWKRDDPMKDAGKYLDQIPGIGEKYYDPIRQTGQRAGSTLEGEYGKMLNPTDFMNELMKNYSESAGAKYQREQLGKGIGATAAAGGIAGTPEHQRQYGEMADKVMSGDIQQFLQNALGIYGRGLSGEENFYNKGVDASGAMADLLSGLAGSKAGLAFQTDTQRNADRSALMNAIVKAFTQAAAGA